MAKKKTTRKELLNKPDEFITLSSKIFKFASTYQTQIFFGLILFIVLIVSIIGVRYYSNKAEKQASDMLGMMMAKYDFINNKSGPEAAYQAVERESQQLIDQYSNREGGKLASVIFADICYNADKIDKAIELYKKALNYFDDSSTIEYFILNGLGYCYEKENDYKMAVKYFKMIAEGHDNAMKSEALYNLGRLYAEMGDREKSLAAFKKVLSEHSNSTYVELIEERIDS